MKVFYLLCMLLFFNKLLAQESKKHIYFNEIGYEYGIFNSLNAENKPDLYGEIMKLKYTHFFGQKWGVHTGFNFISQMEGSDIIYSIPLHIVHRSAIDNSIGFVGNSETFGEFLFSLILAFLPKQSEFFAGINLGYLKPDNNIVFADINGDIYPYYDSEQRFFSTVDLGLSLKYRISRIGISINPCLSYLLSSNFKYHSENSAADLYSPKLFMNGTIGISYNF